MRGQSSLDKQMGILTLSTSQRTGNGYSFALLTVPRAINSSFVDLLLICFVHCPLNRSQLVYFFVCASATRFVGLFVAPHPHTGPAC